MIKAGADFSDVNRVYLFNVSTTTNVARLTKNASNSESTIKFITYIVPFIPLFLDIFLSYSTVMDSFHIVKTYSICACRVSGLKSRLTLNIENATINTRTVHG